MFGAVFGLASIFGPLLGSLITEHLSWRWVFYINLPAGIVTFFLVVLFYHESRQHNRQRIDWLGIVTLIPAIVVLMFALEFGGNKYAWNSFEIVGAFIVAVMLFAVFLIIERKAEEPIVSFHMFRNRVFAGSNFVGLLSGSAYIVVVIYVPIYIQGVLGGSTINAGLELLPMMLATSITAPLGGMFANKWSYRSVLLPFAVIFIVGIYLLTTLTPASSTLQVTVYMAIVGLGTGPFFSVIGLAAMSEFDARHRGAASSTNAFIRELGMTVGIVIFGVIQKDDFQTRLTQAFAGMGHAPAGTTMDPHAMLSPAQRANIPGFILHKLTSALSYSVTHSIAIDLIPAVFALLLLFWMGNGRFRKVVAEPVQHG